MATGKISSVFLNNILIESSTDKMKKCGVGVFYRIQSEDHFLLRFTLHGETASAFGSRLKKYGNTTKTTVRAVGTISGTKRHAHDILSSAINLVPKGREVYTFNQPEYTPYSKMAAGLCGYKLALVASFKIKYSFEF